MQQLIYHKLPHHCFLAIMLIAVFSVVYSSSVSVSALELKDSNTIIVDSEARRRPMWHDISSTFERSVSLNELDINDIDVASGKQYNIQPGGMNSGMQEGSIVYIDRDYKYSFIPECLRGSIFIQSANSDKSSQSDDFLKFYVKKPVTVYVIYDDRYAIKPMWLSDFRDTKLGVLVKTSNYSYSMKAFCKDFPSGTITLGGNRAENAVGNFSMYTVAIIENKFDINDIDVASGKQYNIQPGGMNSGMQEGSIVYIDRDYKYSFIPECLRGSIFIQSANSDKSSQSDDFLKFYVKKPVTVYVIYDDRYAIKPMWLSDFRDTKQKVQVVIDKNNNVSLTMRVFAKNFPIGWITLGGNRAENAVGNFSMYTVAIIEQALNITHLSINSGLRYKIVPWGLKKGTNAYIDEPLCYKSVPSLLKNSTIIQTAVIDKSNKSSDFIRFFTERPVTVYVMYDDQYSYRPAWLNNFKDINQNVEISYIGQEARNFKMKVLARNYPVGWVALGGNDNSYNSLMYTVAISCTDLLSLDPVLIPGYRYLASYLLNNDLRSVEKIPMKPFDLFDSLPDIDIPFSISEYESILKEMKNAHRKKLDYEWVIEKVSKGSRWGLNDNGKYNYFVYGLIARSAGVPEWLILRPYALNKILDEERETFWASNMVIGNKRTFKKYLNDNISEFFAERFLIKLGIDFFEEINISTIETEFKVLNPELWEGIIYKILNESIQNAVEILYLDCLGLKRENMDYPIIENVAATQLINAGIEIGEKAVKRTVEKRLNPWWPAIDKDFKKAFYNNLDVNWNNRIGVKIQSIKQNEQNNCTGSYDTYAPIPDEPKQFNDVEALKATLDSPEYRHKLLNDSSLDFYDIVKMAITPAKYHIIWIYGETHPRAILYIPYTLKYNEGTVSIEKNPYPIPNVFSDEKLKQEPINMAVDTVVGELYTAAFGQIISTNIGIMSQVIAVAHVLYDGLKAKELERLKYENPLIFNEKAQEEAKRLLFENIAKEINPNGPYPALTPVFHNIMKRAEAIWSHNQRVFRERCGGNGPKWDVPRENDDNDNHLDNSQTEKIPLELGRNFIKNLNREINIFYDEIKDLFDSGECYGLVNMYKYNNNKTPYEFDDLQKNIGNSILKAFTRPLCNEGYVGGVCDKYLGEKKICYTNSNGVSECSFAVMPDDEYLLNNKKPQKNDSDEQQHSISPDTVDTLGFDSPEIPPELRGDWPYSGTFDWYDW